MAAPEAPGLPGPDRDPERVPAVVASHVSITYRVFGHSDVKESEAEAEASALRRLLPGGRSNTGLGMRSVEAVQDVSFVAYQGESIGLIGRNGSGKSTLLRSIAGLVPPTSGSIWLNGRAALLGVSAALLPKLSGRRNVEIGLLSLGLGPREVARLAGEVIEFADIGDFIDLPMSTYSSGMGARLRFAISTAVVPDILVVDEALSTGDAQFRDRATERIEQIREQAGTIFMVSHSASSIKALCSRVLWLDGGRLLGDGEPTPVFGLYDRKYGKNRQVWRERYEQLEQLIEDEGFEAARDLLRKWEPRAGW